MVPSKEQLDFYRTNTMIVVLAFSLIANVLLVRYVLEQNERTILKQEDIIKDYRNNYIMNKKIEDRAEMLK